MVSPVKVFGVQSVSNQVPGVVVEQKTGKELPSIVVNISDVVEVNAVGIVAVWQPLRSIIGKVEAKKPLRSAVKRWAVKRQAVRKYLFGYPWRRFRWQN